MTGQFADKCISKKRPYMKLLEPEFKVRRLINSTKFPIVEDINGNLYGMGEILYALSIKKTSKSGYLKNLVKLDFKLPQKIQLNYEIKFSDGNYNSSLIIYQVKEFKKLQNNLFKHLYTFKKFNDIKFQF